uniref:Putative LOC100197594 [Hydra vulgaris] n=1 Tax=Lepeophtheirus salmonis TaxID=72036 RepID=A0A0K2T6D5_LEPSM
MTDTLKERVLQRCKKVRAWIKANRCTVKKFSDEKIFTMDQVYNRQNKRWLGHHQRWSSGCSVQNMRHKQWYWGSWR